MSKSYQQISDRPRRTPPEWAADLPDVQNVITTDTEFGVCRVLRDAKTTKVAWRNGRGLWAEAAIETRRIKQVVR